MSGTGGGGSYQPQDSEILCEDLDFETSLASPNPDAVTMLEKGKVLEVDIKEMNGKKIIAVLDKDEIVGSIIERVKELIRCLQEGNKYEAEVLSAQGGAIKVQIRLSS